MTRRSGWILWAAAIAVCYCVLSFYQTSNAAPKTTGGEPPFANSVEQRIEMNNYLRDIRDLLKEQNDLLRSGTLRVVVSEPEKR